VFYSLFEDLGESFSSGRIARILEALRLRGRKTVAVTVSTIIAIASAFGQTAPPQAVKLEPLQEVQVPARVGISGQTKITLSETIERTLANDPDLRISRIQRDEAGFSLRAAQGAYDPVFGISGSRTRAVVPESSILSGTETGKLTTLQWTGGPQLNGITTTGATYSLQFTSTKQQNDSLFNTLNPQYPTSVSLNLTQPLWRGLRFDENRYRIQVARKNRQISNEQLRQRIIEVVTQAVSAYWELDYASHNLDVQVEAVRLAERQYQSNRRLAEQGVLAPVDVVAAQTQVATFEQSLFAAQQLLTQAENNLKTLVLPNRTDLMWSMGLVVESPLSVSTKPPSLEDAIARALKSRPELSETALSLDVNQLDNKLTHEQTKPRIDAFANLSASGLAGVTTPTASNPLAAFFPAGTQFVPTLLMGNYGQSLSTLAAGTFPSAQIGVNVSLPLRNRTAQAQAAISQAEGRRLRTTQEQIGMAIEADVRNALQAVLATQSRLDAAALASRSADEQYLSEQRQFQAGTSTVFLVLQRQTDLIAARSREVRARADAGEAIANLDRATAGTIEARGIKVE
jgi:HAE1 family hydrophobic/amphiphilic exporter-1